MPYARPHSRRGPDRRDRPWVFTGATSLAGVAGFVNVVVLGFFHVPVSHMSGAVSRAGIDIVHGDASDLRLVLWIVAGFLAGCVVCGAVIGGRKLQPGRRYGVTLWLEGALLAAASELLLRGHPSGVPVAAMALGIQNAMASSYYGLVIRTTHVTGIVTDIGVMLGHWVRHRRTSPWKMVLLTGILLAFFTGGVLGALALDRMGMRALLLAAAGCGTAGTLYYAWMHARSRSAAGR
ncbi:YoaK family protein [Longimicrobium sp.]|uniref:YoaK family protein n=1 Tax=Longimicrobium sp. TaxID=2029185 RepID=UPI002E33F1F3|nr:YoaK family protein [Longimicrobium sp.]HEX6037768.1 YoaK family protein [Longimicrobium sp.]